MTSLSSLKECLEVCKNKIFHRLLFTCLIVAIDLLITKFFNCCLAILWFRSTMAWLKSHLANTDQLLPSSRVQKYMSTLGLDSFFVVWIHCGSAQFSQACLSRFSTMVLHLLSEKANREEEEEVWIRPLRLSAAIIVRTRDAAAPHFKHIDQNYQCSTLPSHGRVSNLRWTLLWRCTERADWPPWQMKNRGTVGRAHNLCYKLSTSKTDMVPYVTYVGDFILSCNFKVTRAHGLSF